jgi:hypothetical protein
MGAIRHVLSTCGGLVVVASIARADAPVGSTGQYGVKGASGAPIFGPADVTILDNYTKLTWQRSAYSQSTLSFLGAATYCANLSLLPFASGWRVPSYKELLTLVDESPHTEYENGIAVTKYIDSHAFGPSLSGVGYTPVDAFYWSSSLTPADSTVGYVINFKTGSTVVESTGNGAYVRCVHDCTNPSAASCAL